MQALSISPDGYEEYVEDKQHCYKSETNPEFTKNHVFNKSKYKERSLKEDLKKANFPSEIVNKADEVFAQMQSGLKRGVGRKQLVFHCVQTAYNLLNIPEDPAQLAQMCGLSHSEMTKAASICSASKVNYQPPPKRWLPKDFLELYFQKIVDMDIVNFSDGALEDIEMICDEVMEKSRELYDEKPQTVAAAMIVFYLGLHNCAIEKKRYTEIFARSEMTVTKLKNKVSAIYNS